MEAYLVHGIDQGLSGISGKAARQFGPILVPVRGDLVDLGNDFIRHQAFVGRYVGDV